MQLDRVMPGMGSALMVHGNFNTAVVAFKNSALDRGVVELKEKARSVSSVSNCCMAMTLWSAEE